MFISSDENFMRAAIALAERGKGAVSPNPPVGCVIVKNDQIIGEGFHRRYGEAHAEINALNDAANHDKNPAGATAYVTLMPCNHFGKTPPCVAALLDAKIGKVIAAIDDPNPTSGDGATKLRENGVEVAIGLLADAAREVMRGFLKFIDCGLPHLTVKYAMTLDGKIAQADGKSQWVSGESSRDYAQVLRARADAILIGANTFRADNPRLNVRLPELSGAKPRRVIIATDLSKIDPQVSAFAAAGGEWLIFCAQKPANEIAEKFSDRGVKIIAGDSAREVDLRTALKILADNFGVREILCEGGARLNAKLLQAKLADAAAVFIAPTFLGGTGISATESKNSFPLSAAPKLRNPQMQKFGDDFFITGKITD